MRRFVLFLALTSFLLQGPVSAQETSETAEIQEETPLESVVPQKTKKNGDLQNWLFAASCVLSATIGIVIVSLNQGSSSPSTMPE